MFADATTLFLLHYFGYAQQTWIPTMLGGLVIGATCLTTINLLALQMLTSDIEARAANEMDEKPSLRYPAKGKCRASRTTTTDKASVSKYVPLANQSYIRRVDATATDAATSWHCPKLDRMVATDIAERTKGR